jgi:cell division protein FtsL
MNQSILTINNEIKELSRKIEDKTHEKNEVQAEVERSN